MKKIMQRIDLIKRNEKTKSVVELIVMIIHVFLLAMMILNLGYTWEAPFQIFQEYYLGIAVFYFLVSIAFLQRVKVFNIINIIFAIIYTIIAHKNLMGLVEMPDLYNTVLVKWMCAGLMCVLTIDMLMYKKIAKIAERNIKGMFLYLIIALVAFFWSGGIHFSYLLLFPFLCLLLLRVEKVRLRQWIFLMTLGYYAAFTYTMIKSFIMVPYTGERYYGIYTNHGFFGMFIGGAFVCSLWWLIMLVRKKASLWKRILILIPIGFALICILMNESRGTELAVGVVGFIVICMWGGMQNKRQMFYRLAVISILVSILLVLLFGGLYILNSYDKETLQLVIQNDILREKLLYWHDRAHTLFNAESKYGIFESGSIINAIDRFSSGRLSHWITYFRAIEFSPDTKFYLEVNGYTLSQPHNVYIYWLYGLGIIPGAGLIIWIIFYLVQTIRQILKKNDLCVLSFLWVIYFMVTGINDSVNFAAPVGFLTILLYYPLIVKYKDAKKLKEEYHG